MTDADIAKLSPKLREELIKNFKDSEKLLEKGPQYDEVEERLQQYQQQVKRLGAARAMGPEESLSELLAEGHSAGAVDRVSKMEDADIAKLSPKLREGLIQYFKASKKTLEDPDYKNVSEIEGIIKEYDDQVKRLEKVGLDVSTKALKSLDIGIDDGASITTSIDGRTASDGQIGRSELARISNTAANGIQWDAANTIENTKRRAELASALDLDGDGKVSKEEIIAATNAAKKAGISLDVDALSRVIESGQLSPSISTPSNQAQQAVIKR